MVIKLKNLDSVLYSMRYKVFSNLILNITVRGRSYLDLGVYRICSKGLASGEGIIGNNMKIMCRGHSNYKSTKYL